MASKHPGCLSLMIGFILCLFGMILSMTIIGMIIGIPLFIIGAPLMIMGGQKLRIHAIRKGIAEGIEEGKRNK